MRLIIYRKSSLKANFSRKTVRKDEVYGMEWISNLGLSARLSGYKLVLGYKNHY
jgi:hypothetical protein